MKTDSLGQRTREEKLACVVKSSPLFNMIGAMWVLISSWELIFIFLVHYDGPLNLAYLCTVPSCSDIPKTDCMQFW